MNKFIRMHYGNSDNKSGVYFVVSMNRADRIKRLINSGCDGNSVEEYKIPSLAKKKFNKNDRRFDRLNSIIDGSYSEKDGYKLGEK